MPTKSVSKLLTISLVSFNTKALLRRCLTSIFKFTKGLKFEVIVVDNASTDGSAKLVKKYFPRVKLIENQINCFYTGANNQALEQANGRYFLILNSDIFIKDNAFLKLTNYLKHHPRVGAVEPLQQYENGRIVSTGSKHNSFWLDLIELTILHKLVKPKALADFRLKSFDRTKTWPADVICDAALIVKTAVLKKLHGYDEKLKLYYTENDLCKRLQAIDLSTIHCAGATVWHRVSASTDKAGWKTISGIFSYDALVYYSKYHSRLVGLGLFLAMKLSNLIILLKQNLGIILIILLATWLRFYRLPETMAFIGDQGRDFLAARDMVLTGQWPLVGIASSVPWLKQGPFFIWMIAAVFKSTGFNPLNPAILTAVLGVLTVYLVYRFSRSLLAALVMACSPLAVIHSRLAYHTSPIPLFSVLYLLALNSQSIFLSFLLSGILLQFELSTFPILIFTYIKFKFKKISFVWLIPFIPKIIYDFSHGFTQTLGFGAWSIHRLFEWHFFNPALTTIGEYWQKFISWDRPILALILGILALKALSKHKLLFSFLLINLLAFYLHAGPSEAYFPVLFPVWAIAFGFIKNKLVKIGVVCLCLFNVIDVVRHDFYHYGPVLNERINLVKQVLMRHEPFRLKNPESVRFESYLDNYRYLIWWLGSAEDPQAKTVYTFYQ